MNLESQQALILVGRDTDSDEIVSIAEAELKSETLLRVSFLGERTDVGKLLEGADIFVLTSRYEGMPIAALEALATGLPVVITNVGGAEEICGDKFGVIAMDRQPETIASALEIIAKLVNTNKWDREASREHFEVNFTKEAFLFAMKRVYQGYG